MCWRRRRGQDERYKAVCCPNCCDSVATIELACIYFMQMFWGGNMSEWQRITLGSVSTKIGSGATPSGGSNVYKLSGVPLIRSQNILDFGFSKDGLVYIDDNQAYELRSVTIEKNDVLLNITGDSVARCCVVPDGLVPARVNQHVAIIRLKPELANYIFVFYLLQQMKDELLMQSEIGATRKALTKGMIENLEVILPALPEQCAIAAVLSSLDDKIDLLHRQNKTLEAMAETLFRQWFVEDAGEDWEDGTLGNVIYFYNGKSRPASVEGGTIPIYGGNGILGHTTTSNTNGVSIIVGRVGAYCGSLYVENRPIWITDNALSVKPKITTHTSYVYYLLKSLNLNQMAQGSSHPLLTQTLLNAIEVVIPPVGLVSEFCCLVDGLLTKAFCNKIQIQTLEKLRDNLLPKLMSREVRVDCALR